MKQRKANVSMAEADRQRDCSTGNPLSQLCGKCGLVCIVIDGEKRPPAYERFKYIQGENERLQRENLEQRAEISKLKEALRISTIADKIIEALA